jgi:hypothetical protein
MQMTFHPLTPEDSIRQRKGSAKANVIGLQAVTKKPLQSFTGSSDENIRNSAMTTAKCQFAVLKSNQKANTRQFPFQTAGCEQCLKECVFLRNKSSQHKVNKGFNFTHTKNLYV